MTERAQKLIDIYSSAKQRLIDLIDIKIANGNATVYQKTLLRQLDAELQRLNKDASNWTTNELPAEYYEAVDLVDSTLTDAGLEVNGEIVDTALAALHTQAVDMIVTNTFESLINANNYIGRQWRDTIRQLGLEATAQKFATGSTWKEMQKQLKQKLIDNKINGIAAKNGRIIPVDSYAALVARTTTREATNSGTFNQLGGLGYDLVKMTSHSPTCPICAPLQGRVYSISGKDPRFPPLSKALNGLYKTVHPNCEHSFPPYVVDRFSDEESHQELKQDMEHSNKDFDIDPRSAAEKEKYETGLKEKAQLNSDRKQFDKYKAVLGDDEPKTFSLFRRYKNANADELKAMEEAKTAGKEEINISKAKKADSKTFAILQTQYKGMGFYNKAIGNEPAITKEVTALADKIGVKSEGLEFRIKDKSSYLRKIKSNYSPDGNSYEIKDILRYTYTASPNALAEKTILSIDEFNKSGYNTIEVKNSWIDNQNPYKGINTTVKASNGQKFEMQYHTPESFALKNGKLHELYEKARVLDPKSSEFLAFQDEMFNLSDKLTIPEGIEGVKNKR